MSSEPLSVNVRQVIPKDAIPSVDEPEFGAEHVGDSDDEAIVIDEADPRAYPLRILNYHEIVNDRIGGRPVAVTWCPLCGSAVVYDRRVETADGERELTFGVSGKLADDDLVMYDRETESEWKQSSGECFGGELSGIELTPIPAAVTTIDRFDAEHDDGLVLQPPGGESEAAGEGADPEPIEYDDAPYGEYFDSDGFGLAAHRGEGDGRRWDRDDLDPKTVVLGLEFDGDALGVPLPVVEASGGVAETEIGGTHVVVFATDDGIHAFENPGIAFEADDDGTVRGDGTTWDGSTGESADGRTLDRVPARRLFAFAWRDDHGDAFYETQ